LRPSYPAGFSGDGGIEKIQEEIGGWPHLVQLVAETCVDLLNDEAQSAVNATILEQAFEKSVVRCEAVFYELRPPEDEAIARSLKLRGWFWWMGTEGEAEVDQFRFFGYVMRSGTKKNGATFCCQI